MKKILRGLLYDVHPKINNTFIIASPRSGTTWISKAINAHGSIYCTERRLFGEYADLINDDGKDEVRLRCTLDHFVRMSLKPQVIVSTERLFRAYLKALMEEEYIHCGKRIVIDKITPYVHTTNVVAKGIDKYFPKSKLIFLLRDGRDVCTSGVFHWFNKNPTTTSLTDFELLRRTAFIEKKKFNLDRFFTDAEIEEWAHTWSQPLRIITKLSNHKIKLISFEDMLLDQGAVVKEVFKFVGVNSSSSVISKCIHASSFKKMSDNRQRGEEKVNVHVRKGVAGDWKNYFVRKDAEIFQKIAGDMLLQFGYVSSSDWVDEVPLKLKVL